MEGPLKIPLNRQTFLVEFATLVMGRGDSMVFTFDSTPLASRQGLCDIDRVQFRVNQNNFKKWNVLARRNYADVKSNGKTRIPPYQDFLFF